MKKVILLVALVVIGYISYGQYFEGEIIYENTCKSRIQGLSDEKLGSLIGTKQAYFIKSGQYKSITNSSIIVMQLYDDKANRLYNKRPGSDTLYWIDASTNDDEVLSYEVKKGALTILGNQCDALIAKTKTGTTTIYYDSKYAIDSTKFRDHNYGNWAFIVLKTGAVPLKTIIENSQFTMESTAVEIKPAKLKPDLFNVDPNAPIKKGL